MTLREPSPDLERACERALFTGARAARAGTRQQVRAAARRFVRRNRRNAALLHRVLRGALASAAFAAAVLGLGPATATADAPLLLERSGAANPFDGEDPGSYSAPALGDLDGDGDLDAVVGLDDGSFAYYENTGSRIAASFVLRTGGANPLDGADAGAFASPSLADADGDGDLDLLSGRDDGSFAYYENTGSRVAPTFVQRTGVAHPLDGQDAGLFSAPAFVDVDSDGDADVVSGELFGAFRYFENTGDATSPSFVQRLGAANPLDGGDLGTFSAPVFGDLDGDGDLELVSGESGGGFAFVDNTGNAASLIPELLEDAASPLAGAAVVGGSSHPSLGDLDGDGDLDAIAGGGDGTLAFFENLAGDFVERTGAANPLDFGVAPPLGDSTPAIVDLDADGDLDVVSGDQAGALVYFENTGTETDPAYVERTGAANPLAGLALGNDTAPAFSDLDGDGDFDAVVGRDLVTLAFLENIGTASSPFFIPVTSAPGNPFSLFEFGYSPGPAIADLDDDGDFDLVAGDSSGTFAWLENTGNPANPAFVFRFGVANPLEGFDVGADARPGIADVDGDRDPDFVAGSLSGGLAYFENIGAPDGPVIVERVGSESPLGTADVGTRSAVGLGDIDGDGDVDVVSGSASGSFHFFENAVVEPAPRARLRPSDPLAAASVSSDARPALGDLDADGDLDLVVGDFAGTFTVLENTGTAISPAFSALVGAESPLDGADVGVAANPALGDLDADGDLDLVAGENQGTFLYFENVGSATASSFVLRLGAANPLDGEDVGFFSEPTLCDLDADGDLDLVTAAASGVLRYFENTGTAASPAFVERTSGANPFDPATYGVRSPAFADFDRDGDRDLLAGDLYGTFRYFENTGDVTSAVFVERTGADHPLDGEDVGSYSSPALGDIDADGDLEVVVGGYDGDFTVYTLPEPRGPFLWSAALLLLQRLARHRRRTSS